MKNGVKVTAYILCIILYIISIPFLAILWFLGSEKPFENLSDCMDNILD